jgi:protein gp37
MPTTIEWTGETWNPVTGCAKLSVGCQNCYAERMAKRLRGRCGYPADEPFRVTVHEKKLDQPLRWRKPRHVFVCSMGDLFHPRVTDETIFRVFGVMYRAHWHTYQVLTKRPERMQRVVERLYWGSEGAIRTIYHYAREHEWPSWYGGDGGSCRVPLPNVWLGVSAENQEQAQARIPALLETPAAVRFVSVEPMLGPVDLREVEGPEGDRLGDSLIALGGAGTPTGIDWVICGGESGPGARPMHPDWARSLRDQCVGAHVPFFFKQWGGVRKKPAGALLDDELWQQMPVEEDAR